LHIEKLILHGFAPGDRPRIGAALTAELARILAEQGVPQSLAQSGDIPRLDGGRFEVGLGSGAEEIGTQVAQALYRGLKP
ncbi:MAG: hypothetical protein IMY75_12175, partial [Chloroflexi bacterium]|nr:hypothetical protein [Chloroflexota bacterium]